MTIPLALRFALLSTLFLLVAVVSGAASCEASVGNTGDDDGNAAPDKVITSVTLTKSVEGDNYKPGPATTVFGPKDTIYAVASIKNAPKGTTFSSRWVAVDVGSVAAPGTEIDVAEVTGGGTKNIEFHMETSNPNGFPPGKYAVEISVDDEVQKTLEFTVK